MEVRAAAAEPTVTAYQEAELRDKGTMVGTETVDPGIMVLAEEEAPVSLEGTVSLKVMEGVEEMGLITPIFSALCMEIVVGLQAAAEEEYQTILLHKELEDKAAEEMGGMVLLVEISL